MYKNDSYRHLCETLSNVIHVYNLFGKKESKKIDCLDKDLLK